MMIHFEIHITLAQLAVSRTEAFEAFCAAKEAKPILIELAQGAFRHQPMLSKVIALHTLEEALAHATELTDSFLLQAFTPTRVKIEIPASDVARYRQTGGPGLYYEWHGKVPYEKIETLLLLCERHMVHLSVNALRNQAQVRFVTLREMSTVEMFQKRLQLLTAELTNNGWPVIKQQTEFCIYDNNIQLDTGWLPL